MERVRKRQVQHQEVISPTFPKGPVDDDKIYTVSKKMIDTIILFLAYCHCHCEETHIYLLLLQASSHRLPPTAFINPLSVTLCQIIRKFFQ